MTATVCQTATTAAPTTRIAVKTYGGRGCASGTSAGLDAVPPLLRTCLRSFHRARKTAHGHNPGAPGAHAGGLAAQRTLGRDRKRVLGEPTAAALPAVIAFLHQHLLRPIRPLEHTRCPARRVDFASAGEQHAATRHAAPKAQTPIHAQVPYCTITTSRLESRHRPLGTWCTEGASRRPGGPAVNLSGTKDRGSGSLAGAPVASQCYCFNSCHRLSIKRQSPERL